MHEIWLLSLLLYWNYIMKTWTTWIAWWAHDGKGGGVERRNEKQTKKIFEQELQW